MKLKHLWKAAGLVALSAILILTLCLAGLLALVLRSAQITQFWNAPLTKLSQSLVLEEGRYHFTGEDLLAQQDLWLMLVGRDGQVLWQYNKPAEVPDQYDLLDVAAFTRWYLEEDGGPAHGTGLKLVAQIAAAHGGQAAFFQGETFLCQLRLPMRPS